MIQQNIVQDRLQDLFPVHYRNGNILMINADCMDVMKHIKDKEVELSCVDPPYGIGMDTAPCARLSRYGNVGKADNNPPKQEYFDELFRVSKNQIVWGGNYFVLPPSRCFLIWDKQQPENVSFASCEFAWTSFNEGAKTFYQRPQGDQTRIHPTQKPVALYKWLLSRYAKPGDRILDTHGGSGSICIACHDLGYDLTWMELDADYYKAAYERYQNHAAQGSLFDNAALTADTVKQGEMSWS